MIVRKHLKRIALISLLILCMSIPVLALESTFKIFIDEKEISFNEGIGFPELKAGRTMIPIRIVSENMGYKVDWNKDNWSKDKSIYISNADRKITFEIGESTAVVNGKKVNIDERDGKVVDTKSYISAQNRTMVPVRFIAETMGAKVEYDKKGDIHHVFITTKGDSGVIGDKDDGKVEEKPIEKPVEPDVEDKDWIEPEWDFVNGMESDRSLKLYLNNDEEFIKRNARFSTKMVGPTSKKYRYLNWEGKFIPGSYSKDMNDSYQDRSIDHSPEVFELFLYENVKDNNGNILPIVKEGEKFYLEIEIKMNGKSKVYKEVFTVPKSY